MREKYKNVVGPRETFQEKETMEKPDTATGITGFRGADPEEDYKR